jgi:large subunit ribosomal protein L4e
MRGHNIPESYPFILSSDFEKISRTSDLKTSLIELGFKEELSRSEFKKVRAGVGKNRGRKYNKKKSLLIVVASDCPLINSARNLPGIEVVAVNGLNCNVLAPGASAGRVTLWSENAIKKLEEEKLFQ